ncbi:gypsy type transposase [Tanacetum coccineum]
MLLSDGSSFTSDYRSIRKDTNLNMGQWHSADEYDGQVREITFRCLCNSPMCPPDTAMTEWQHILLSPDKHSLVFETVQQAHDVPFGSYFEVDSRVFPISVPLYTGGVLEKDLAPHLTAHQEQVVQVISSNKAPFQRYPECFLALVGLSPYYPFGENTYPAFEGPDRTDMGLLDYIRTADPRKVQAVEVQKGEEQVTLFDSIKHCFVSLNAPAAAHQASGSGSGVGTEVSVSSAEGNVVEENVIPEGAFLNPTDPECDVTVAEKDVAQRQPEKAKRKKLLKRSDPLPAKRLRIDHPSLASGTGGKSLASLRQSLPEGSLTLGASSPADIPTHVTVPSSCAADAPVYTAADIVTSSRGKTLVLPTSGVGGSSQPETSEESTDSFYETAVLNSEDAKRWYIPRWNITNDSLLDDGFSCRTLVDRVAPPGFFSTLRNMDYDQLFEEFNVGAARQICLGSEVRSRAEHELELKEKLRGKYDARGVLLREKDAEIARLKSLLEEKETESAEVPRLRDQVSVLAADKSLLSAEVSALKNVVSQKDTDISLLDSRASYLKSALDDSQAACGEARSLISSLSSERDGLASEVSTLHSSFRDFKEKMEAQQEEQAQELYNRVAELEAHVMDVSGRLEGEFYPAYLTALAGRKEKWSEPVDYAAYLQPCLEQLFVPIYYADVNAVVGETSLSFALLNVHTRAEGAKRHASALRQLMVDIVSHPLSSQNLLGEASTSSAVPCVEDLDTDEDLGSVVCMPQFEDPRFEILP